MNLGKELVTLEKTFDNERGLKELNERSIRR